MSNLIFYLKGNKKVGCFGLLIILMVLFISSECCLKNKNTVIVENNKNLLASNNTKTTVLNESTSNVVSIATGKVSSDRVYFLSLRRGNAILFQSTNSKGEKIYGMFDVGDDGADATCGNLLKELKGIIGDSGLEFIIFSHMDGDHVGCSSKVMSGVKVKNIYIKKYSDLNLKKDGKLVKRTISKNYDAILKVAKANKINLNLITSNSQEAKNNEFYVVDKNGKKVSSSLNIENKTSDWNKSYGTLNFGNFKFYIMNLAQRQIDKIYLLDNYNSLVLYSEVNGKRLYFMGDIQNTTYRGVSDYSYDGAPYTTGANNLSDFYASYVQSFTGGNSVDLIQLGHHGTISATDVYILKKMANKSTKFVFTFAYNDYTDKTSVDGIVKMGINDTGYGSTEAKKCKNDSSSYKFKCLNDRMIKRIMYVLYNYKLASGEKVVAYYQNNLTAKNDVSNQNETLKFGFNYDGNPSAKVTSEGGFGTKIVYRYNSTWKNITYYQSKK